MAVNRYPVWLFRFFRSGENFAFDHSLAQRYCKVETILNPEFQHARGSGRIDICRRAFEGWLVGERVDDSNCPDPKAQGRRPFILRVAYVDQPDLDQPDPPSVTEQALICEKLADLQVDKDGRQPLTISVPERHEYSETSNERRIFLIFLMICVLAAASFITWFSEILAGKLRIPTQLVAASGGVIFLIAVKWIWHWLFLKAAPDRELAEWLESEWGLVRATKNPESRTFLAPNWRAQSGTSIDAEKTGECSTLSQLPMIDLDAPASTITSEPDVVAIQGPEIRDSKANRRQKPRRWRSKLLAALFGFFSRASRRQEQRQWLHLFYRIENEWKMVLILSLSSGSDAVRSNADQLHKAPNARMDPVSSVQS